MKIKYGDMTIRQKKELMKSCTVIQCSDCPLFGFNCDPVRDEDLDAEIEVPDEE